MTTRDQPYCDCFRAHPWPAMLLLYIGRGSRHYYVCPRCGTIREDISRPGKGVVVTHLHPPESPSLPAAVIEQARAILAAPRYRQLSLFEV